MNLITREELRERLERGDELQLVMALPEHAFRAKRIPGSRSFTTIGDALDALDPGDEIVLYCATVYCPASIWTYRLLEREGYRRVYRYAGGLDDWEAAEYPVETGVPRTGAASKKRSRRTAARPFARRRWPALAA
jgi:rhodanese-related sulfurtransferase